MSSDTDKGPTDNPDKPQDMSRDELEDALNWLENLASKQGKSLEGITPLEEGSLEESPFKGLFESDEGDLPDWLRDMPSDPDSGDPDLDRASRLDWLARMANQESIEELPTLEWRQLSSYGDELDSDEDNQPDARDDLADLFDEPSPSQTATLTASSLMIVDEPAEEADTEPEAALPPEGQPDETVNETVINLPPPAPPVDLTPVEGVAEPELPVDELDRELSGEAEADLPAETDALVDPVVYPEPDDLDAAMAWLEELAASTEAPIEDLPSVADRALASKLMAEAVSGQANGPDEADVASAKAVVPPPQPAEVEQPADVAGAGVAALAATQLTDHEREAESKTEVIAPPEEPDPQSESGAPATAEAQPATEDLLAYLDRMAVPSGRSLSEIEARLATLPAAYLISPYSLDSTLDWLSGVGSTTVTPSAPATSAPDLLSADLVAAMPEDPDEALRWLESMAEAEPPATREVQAETPSGSTLSVEVTEADLLDMPDDPDEAMAWIENLAARGGKKE